MLSPLVRLILVLALSALGGYQLSVGRASGSLYMVIAIGLAYGYFRYGAVWAAWRAVKAVNLPRARSLISSIRYPALLSRENLAYYHLIQGLLTMHDQRFDVATDHVLQAVAGALRTSNDRSLALLILAEIKAITGEVEAAREYLGKAQETEHKPGLEDAFKRVESLIEEAG